ncbi:PD-(D/E)XK motif protein [Empedobacter falsenii]
MKLEEFINSIHIETSDIDKIKANKYPNKDLDIYAYYDQSKCLHLLIDSDLKFTENRKGLKIKNEDIEIIDQGKKHFLNFYCTAPDFIPNFIKIFNEILDDYNFRKNLEKSIKIIINKWYFFFEKEKSKKLSDQVILGIIGELFFINQFIEHKQSNNILNHWKGPENYPNDFSFQNYDVEVKVSTKEIGHVHTINGQSQLTIVDNIPMYLYSLSFKRSASESAITIKKLINFILDFIGEDQFSLNEFYEKLEYLEINPYEIDLYEDIRVELKNILTIKLTLENIDQFTIKNLNNRISNIKYDLDINGLEDCTNEIIN